MSNFSFLGDNYRNPSGDIFHTPTPVIQDIYDEYIYKKPQHNSRAVINRESMSPASQDPHQPHPASLNPTVKNSPCSLGGGSPAENGLITGVIYNSGLDGLTMLIFILIVLIIVLIMKSSSNEKMLGVILRMMSESNRRTLAPINTSG
jgi:hypothetical protein